MYMYNWTLCYIEESSTILQIKYTFSFFFFKVKKWCHMIIDFKSILNTLVLICGWQWEVSLFYAVSSKLWNVIWNPLSTLLLDFLFVDLQDLCVCVLSCQVVFNSLWFKGSSPPRSSVHGVFQGRNTGVSCHFLLQGILLTQGLNPHLLCLQHSQTLSNLGRFIGFIGKL